MCLSIHTHRSTIFPLADWSNLDVEYLDLTLDLRGHDIEHGIRSCTEGLNVLPSSRLKKLRLTIAGGTASSMDGIRNALSLFKTMDDIFTRRQFRLLREVCVSVPMMDYCTGDCHHPTQ